MHGCSNLPPCVAIGLLAWLMAVPPVFAAGRAQAQPAPRTPHSIDAALDRAGANRGELERALHDVPDSQRRGMAFLLRYMPDRDLRGLDADYLLENVDLAYQAWNDSPWHDQVSEDLFLEYILPYAVINEARSAWRAKLRDTALPIVSGAATPGEGAVRLNQEIFPHYGVQYSTERSKPDQNPIEVITEQKASCSGLSILLISACRSVGIPARFTGVPLWADSSGNHSWVEVWDDSWRFTGAAEPAGDELDEAWFEERAAELPGDSEVHAIYAARYSPTGIPFPLVWDEAIDYVPAENVTDRYIDTDDQLPDGSVALRFVARDKKGERVSVQVRLYDQQGEMVFEGETKSGTVDMNDHLSTTVPLGASFTAAAVYEGRTLERRIRKAESNELIEFDMSKASGWGRPRR